MEEKKYNYGLCEEEFHDLLPFVAFGDYYAYYEGGTYQFEVGLDDKANAQFVIAACARGWQDASASEMRNAFTTLEQFMNASELNDWCDLVDHYKR